VPDHWTNGGEIVTSGLIEELLVMRETPTPANLDRVSRFLTNRDYADGFTAGIEQALDLLVPAAKRAALLATVQNHGPNCVSKLELEAILGRVPVRRDPRE
jgi:hypothetical protein